MNDLEMFWSMKWMNFYLHEKISIAVVAIYA